MKSPADLLTNASFALNSHRHLAVKITNYSIKIIKMSIYIYFQIELVTSFHINENSCMVNVAVCHFVILLYSIETGLALHNTQSFVFFHVLFSPMFLTTSRVLEEPFFS